MKKFFVALLVLAVVAGNLFAEFSFSGGFFGTWEVVKGESGKTRTGNAISESDSKWLTNSLGLSPGLIRTRLIVTAANEEATWGGWFIIQPSAPSLTEQGYIWWQPISQIKATLGVTEGFRPFGQLGGLDVHDYLSSANYGYDGAGIFPDYGYGNPQGVSLLITPIANLKIGLSTRIGPFEVNNVKQPAEVSYRQTGGWVNYTVEGVGDFALGFKGSSANYTNGTAYGHSQLADAKSQINFGANVTAVENLKLQFGASYPIPQDTDGADVKNIKSVQNPIGIALAADYTVPDVFGVRALASVSLGGKTEYEAANKKDDETGLVIGALLDPWVNIGGVGTLGLSFTIKSTGKSKADGEDQPDDRLDLEVTPYFAKTYGGGAFYIGFRLGLTNWLSDVKTTTTIDEKVSNTTWAIPIGVSYGF